METPDTGVQEPTGCVGLASSTGLTEGWDKAPSTSAESVLVSLGQAFPQMMFCTYIVSSLWSLMPEMNQGKKRTEHKEFQKESK